VILRRKEEEAGSRGKLPASSLNMPSGAKGSSFRLPQFKAVALRVERPSKAAIPVVFGPILHLRPCLPTRWRGGSYRKQAAENKVRRRNPE
jgi:hypothetical protein